MKIAHLLACKAAACCLMQPVTCMLLPEALNSGCRVQFDRREMGVEKVRDVDVMPINPTENLPASFVTAHPHILMNGHAMIEGEPIHHSRASIRDGPPARGPAAGRAAQEARAAAAAAQALSQESDMHTLSEVQAA